MLNCCGVGARAARRLYGDIFVPAMTGSSTTKMHAASRASRTDGHKNASHSGTDGAVFKPRDVRRIPLKHRQALLPLLQRMLRKRTCWGFPKSGGTLFYL